MKKRLAAFFAATALVLAVSTPAESQGPPSGQDENAARALEAIDAYGLAWNSRDPDAFANSLNYPHTRQSPSRATVWQTPEDVVRNLDFEKVVRTGWHHTERDRIEVIHSGKRKAHVATQWTRYDAQGEKLLTYQVTRVVTEVDGKWGVQARFQAGRPVPETERAKNEAAALKAVRDYMDAFNSRDPEACAATLNYPHVRIASGSLRIWETAEEYAGSMDFDQFISETGWHHSNLDSTRAIQIARRALNVALVYTRHDAQGKKIATYETLYFVTEQDGHWGVRARSSLAP